MQFQLKNLGILLQSRLIAPPTPLGTSFEEISEGGLINDAELFMKVLFRIDNVNASDNLIAPPY